MFPWILGVPIPIGKISPVKNGGGMRTTRLGRTGLQVSRVGFGSIPIQRLTDEEAIRVVQRSLDLGITFLDTANAYTTSEGRIGKAIAGRRDGLVLATKTQARDKVTALAHLELSLQRLGTDVIDLWQLHNISTAKALEQVLAPGGALEAVQDARAAGKIRYVGLSSHSLDTAIEAVATDRFDTVQFPFNFVTDEAAHELLPLCRRLDVGFIAMKPFAGGMLGNARLTLKHLLQYDEVVPDPGIQAVEEIEEIAGIVGGSWTLTPQEREELARVRGELDLRFCRRCEYCQPCPQGVKISAVMTMPTIWKRFPLERIFAGHWAEAARGARKCARCGECETRCPYHLQIRLMLEESLALYDRMEAEAGRR
jgi:uncharacterized protein